MSKQRLLKDSGLSKEDFDKLILPRLDEKYTPYSFASPVELLYAIDKRIERGTFSLHPWQRRALTLYSKREYFTVSDPLRFLLCASNGSGKDAYFLALASVWQALTSIRSRFICTSSSFNQLKNQTEQGIRSLAYMFNEWAGEEVLYVKQFHIIAKNTASEILLFATDEAGLAEGYHPFPDWPNAEMTIATNESKTVKDEIFGALKRCNGYNRWLEVSSPGQMSGHFYNMFKEAVKYPEKYVPYNTPWYAMRVTSYDCPHISPKSIEQDKKDLGGEHTALFRSIHLAEFTSQSEAVCIPQEYLIRCLDHPPVKQKGINRVGGDLSAGGDESVLFLVNGNVVREMFCVRIKDTTLLVETFHEKMKEWECKHGKLEEISMDDGNVGKSIIDMLINKGWKIHRVNNQSPPYNKTRFVNRGAEMWFMLRGILEKKLLAFEFRDRILEEQLISRYYDQLLSGKIRLEAKKDARSNGHGSPDRADALVLAFRGYTTEDFEEEFGAVKATVEETPRQRFTFEDLEDGIPRARESYRPSTFSSIKNLLGIRKDML